MFKIIIGFTLGIGITFAVMNPQDAKDFIGSGIDKLHSTTVSVPEVVKTVSDSATQFEEKLTKMSSTELDDVIKGKHEADSPVVQITPGAPVVTVTPRPVSIDEEFTSTKSKHDSEFAKTFKGNDD